MTDSYEKFLITSGDPVAAAILTLAEVINEKSITDSHEICLGIRKGLFGSGASDHESVLSLKRDVEHL